MSKTNDKTLELFFLVRAGMWGDGNPEIRIGENTDWQEIYRLATEQSVLGLVLAGLEHSDVKPPKELLLRWIGEMQMIEQRNKEMNAFIERIISKLRYAEVYAILVKGQGIAQCYEKPLWRVSGDIDLLLSADNYNKAGDFLIPLSSNTEKVHTHGKHIELQIDDWTVELHGTQHSELSARVDKLIDEAQESVFFCGNVRSWMNGRTLVFLPGPDDDVILIFTHILKHFFKEGIGLRQICDWCRLLYAYSDSLNHGLLERRIRKAGLMTEWKAFAAFAIIYLGMPEESMPFYTNKEIWNRKAKRICRYIVKVGNFGHNRDLSYYSKTPYYIRKMISMTIRMKNVLSHMTEFPLDTLKFGCGIIYNGMISASRGE